MCALTPTIAKTWALMRLTIKLTQGGIRTNGDLGSGQYRPIYAKRLTVVTHHTITARLARSAYFVTA